MVRRRFGYAIVAGGLVAVCCGDGLEIDGRPDLANRHGTG